MEPTAGTTPICWDEAGGGVVVLLLLAAFTAEPLVGHKGQHLPPGPECAWWKQQLTIINQENLSNGGWHRLLDGNKGVRRIVQKRPWGSIANDNDNMMIGLCKSATRRDVDNLVAAARFGENKVESRSSFRAASFSAFPVVEGHQHNESFRHSQRKSTGASSTKDLWRWHSAAPVNKLSVSMIPVNFQD